MWQYKPGSMETCRNERLIYCSMYALDTLFLPVLSTPKLNVGITKTDNFLYFHIIICLSVKVLVSL